ncbi:phosphatase PAP2 family protein [Anaerotignum sp.]
MERLKNKPLLKGAFCITTFIFWTILIQTVDVQPVGVNETDVGFAALNCRFHRMTGTNMTLYLITDWLGLVPVFLCMAFATLGLIQWIKRKNLLQVDADILLLGIYYVIVIFAYLIFEMVPINYRPILIAGRMEASYPSSTTLLVLSVMPTLLFQADRRLKNTSARNIIRIFTIFFSTFMVIGRLLSGVHWFTDIVGSVMLSAGLFYTYKAFVLSYGRKKQ